jgi:hypothetical protein
VPRATYPELGAKKVPAFLEGSIDQYTEIRNAEPLRVAGFGLVVNCDPLPNAAIEGQSNKYPTAVREYMVREMFKWGVGSQLKPGWENLSPQRMLDDPRNAIVLVQGLIPPGARAGRSMDIEVAAVNGGVIESLSRGWLYQTDLTPRGGNIHAPGVPINVLAKAQGQVFVNPTLAMETSRGTPGQRRVLREGLILDGGYISADRPLIIQLRTPQLSLSRRIEFRIDQYFQDSKTAAAEDEGIVKVFVPESYKGDWRHFAGVVRYLFLSDNPAFAPFKAKQLVEEALKPNAPLEDISYCWEALGPMVIPYITPLMSNPSPDIAFSAARAAAYVGDASAQEALLSIAQSTGNPFQVNAVHVLGTLKASPAIALKVRTLLNSPDALVRLEAYRMLAAQHDSSIFTRVISKDNEKFVLDLVPSDGPPLIYASRTGEPRIAVIGAKPRLVLPVLFSAFDNRLTITSGKGDQAGLVNIYYRGTEFPEPVSIWSHPDVAELIARLGGEGALDDPQHLDFGYSDVVAMLQSLAHSRKLVATYQGNEVAANFVLQDVQDTSDSIRNAPPLPGEAGK